MKPKIYIFSGLGADERVFAKIDFSKFDAQFITWIMPEKEEEIEDYAKRISVNINCEKPILMGLSFGGMMAMEVAKILNPKQIILIASAKTKYEIPIYFRVLGALKLTKILPVGIFKKSNFITNWFFSVQNKDEQKLLEQILVETPSVFLKWAIDKIVNWENVESPKNVIHIHGTKDRILRIKNIKSDYKIAEGGHLMTLNKAIEITDLLNKLIQ